MSLFEISIRSLKGLSCLFMGVCFGAFLGLLSMQPEFTDDYWYAYQINQAGGLIGFIKYCYYTWTGRFLQIGLLWLGLHSDLARAGFQILSGFAFVGIMVFIAALPLGRIPRIFGEDRLYFLLIALAVWFGSPSIDMTVFWTTGATAYLYPGFVMLLFLVPYTWDFLEDTFSATRSWNRLSVCLFFALGAVTGSSQEQVIFQVGFLLVCWLVWNYGRRTRPVPLQLTWGIIGFGIASVITLTAPGNFERKSYEQILFPTLSTTLPLISSYFSEFIFSIRLSAVLLPILFCSYLMLSSPTTHWSQHRKGYKLPTAFILAATFGLLPIWAMGYFHTERTAFFAVLFVIVACASILAYFWNLRLPSAYRLYEAVFTVLIPLSLLVDMNNGFYASRQLNEALSARERLINEQLQAGHRDLTVPPLKKSQSRLVLVYDELGMVTRDNKFKVYAELRGANSIELQKTKRWKKTQ